jgi:Cu+-exporting ATPase
LNDAGALQAADVGVAITEDINAFSPASDAILAASQFTRLQTFLDYARNSVSIVHASFVISLMYNVIGLGFAVTGRLSPLVSAILMPVSSVTAVAFTTILSRRRARRLGLN